MRNQTIIVDINKEICKILKYKQYDNNNLLQIIVEENCKKVDLKGYAGFAFFQLPSGIIIQKKCSIQENIITVVIDSAILNEEGIIILDLTLSNSEETFTLFKITLSVEKSINRDEIVIIDPNWDVLAELSKYIIEEEIRQENEELRILNENKRQENEEQRLANDIIREKFYKEIEEGIIIKSPNGTKYKIKVSDDGILYTTKQ
jgi:hypothetical protein